MRTFAAKSPAPEIYTTAWWAREDSNLQPDRYERSALTIELRARAAGTEIYLTVTARDAPPYNAGRGAAIAPMQ